MSWLKLANTNCGSLSLTAPTPPTPSMTPPTPPPTLRPLRPCVMDMIPVTTEETMPSPVDPGEAAAEDEEVGDEADVEEDITSYAGRPQPLLTTLEGTPSPLSSPSSPWSTVLRLGIVRIFPSD